MHKSWNSPSGGACHFSVPAVQPPPGRESNTSSPTRVTHHCATPVPVLRSSKHREIRDTPGPRRSAARMPLAAHLVPRVLVVECPRQVVLPDWLLEARLLEERQQLGLRHRSPEPGACRKPGCGGPWPGHLRPAGCKGANSWHHDVGIVEEFKLSTEEKIGHGVFRNKGLRRERGPWFAKPFAAATRHFVHFA